MKNSLIREKALKEIIANASMAREYDLAVRNGIIENAPNDEIASNTDSRTRYIARAYGISEFLEELGLISETAQKELSHLIVDLVFDHEEEENAQDNGYQRKD